MQFKFSVIIPIYNVEKYLEETIQSVINQTIGFEKNIQLILVNDGSPDNSEAICLKYKEKYPNNVEYIRQDNKGVSEARNTGLKYVKGEFVNFLDSDDKWSLDSFKEVYNQYKKHKNIKLFSCKMKYFDAKNNNHILNYKFEKNKIVDYLKEYDYPQLSSCSLFIKSEVIVSRKYSSKLKIGEDARLVNEIILDEQKIMMLKKPMYLYRARHGGDSAMQNTIKNKSWYLVTLKEFHMHLMELSLEKYGKILPFIQYCIMYDVQWRLQSIVPEGILSEKEKKEYLEILTKILKEIDNKIILEQKFIDKEVKIYALMLKGEFKSINDCKIDTDKIVFDEEKIVDLKNDRIIDIYVLNLNENNVEIIGKVNNLFNTENINLYCVCNGVERKIKLNDYMNSSRYSVEGKKFEDKVFRVEEEIDYTKENEIFFKVEYDNKKMIVFPYFLKNSGLYSKFSLHYVYKKRMAIISKNKIIISKYKSTVAFKKEIIFFLQLIKNFRISQMIYRYVSKLSNLFKRKEIWLVSDRTYVAGDNGMYLFEYISKAKKDNIKTYFVINKNSKDYDKMKQLGKVIDYGSFKYKILFLLSDKIISSQADNWVTNCFGKNEKFYRDIEKFDFIFLQHGITKDDQSVWLNIMNKNIRMIITVTQREHDAFLSDGYGYSENEIKLTGFPRYDSLKNLSNKVIAIMPTWRKSCATDILLTDERMYNTAFKESTYYKFYNKLINDTRLISKMKEKGYTGMFISHPAHVANSIDFEENDVFKVVKDFADYQQIFGEANLLITDYSSVAFDFAYLYKPVLYTQFDKEEFFSNHTYSEGYFSYFNDGFGPVVENYEESVKEIIKLIDNDCKIEEKYKKRIDSFYKFHDQKNCERVYNEILKI